MEAIISSLITGFLAFLGVVITTLSNNKKSTTSFEHHQAVIETRINELTREVREHNNFARRMPVVEEKIISINERVKKLEKGK